MTEKKIDLSPIKRWEIIEMKLSGMNPAPYNPKHHTEDFLDKLENSMKLHGMVQFLVWNKRTRNLVDGHGKYNILQRNGIIKGARLEGNQDRAPWIIYDGLE